MTLPAACARLHGQTLGKVLAIGLMALLAACDRGRVDDQPNAAVAHGDTSAAVVHRDASAPVAARDPNTVFVNGDVNHAAVHDLKKARGREPTREELLTLHRIWIDNEILYREGLKLSGVDAGANSREQLIASALAAIDQKVRPTSVPDDDLRSWFESHRDRYEQPARFDFEDASPSAHPSEATIRALVEKLNAEPSVQPDDLRVFERRSEANLQQSYGPEVTAALAKSQPRKWLALRALDGWRAMRLIALTPMSHADLGTQREAVSRDWIEAQTSEKRAAAVSALWQSYTIELAPPFECHAEN